MVTEPGLARQGITHTAKQRQKMLVAIALLLTALAVVVIKDRNFWLGTTEAPSADLQVADTGALSSGRTRAVPASPGRPAPKSKKLVKRTTPSEEPAVRTPAVVSKRTVLPPLSVEVIAGEAHQKLHPENNVLKIEMQSGSIPGPSESAPARAAALSTPPVSNASERMPMSPGITESSTNPADPSSYPLLAKRMRIQGSVVLQALIGSDGLIQDLRVLSGPGILASAAREAVRQWRFKPYLQNGEPIETQARITVNFIISTS